MRDKVLQTFMPAGRVKSWPAKLSKQLILLEELVQDFEPGVAYPEEEVNTRVKERYEDYCLVRRMFVDFGFMRRDEGVYRVQPETHWPGRQYGYNG